MKPIRRIDLDYLIMLSQILILSTHHQVHFNKENPQNHHHHHEIIFFGDLLIFLLLFLLQFWCTLIIFYPLNYILFFSFLVFGWDHILYVVKEAYYKADNYLKAKVDNKVDKEKYNFD